MKVLVTGSSGFVGKNLCLALAARAEVELSRFDVENDPRELTAALRDADVVFHLAGVNRPERDGELEDGNAGLTRELCLIAERHGRAPKIILSSSIQAALDNPYGKSKLMAEEVLAGYCARTGAEGVIHRFKNLFGKWCRPNYNSVTATFCHNIANDLPVTISDPQKVVELTYIDDVVAALMSELLAPSRPGCRLAEPLASERIELAALAELIRSFHEHRRTLVLPDYGRPFVRALYATYLSYLPPDRRAYGLDVKADERGSLAELLKSPRCGQIFVSRTKPGVTRGNHFHHTKTEKFMVVQGVGVIRMRHLSSGEVTSYELRGEDYRVVDIPPGVTHSIENTGHDELVTIFWASEVFDPARPDTTFAKVSE